MAYQRQSQSPDYKTYAVVALAALVLLAGVLWAVGTFIGIGPFASHEISGEVVDTHGEPIENAVIVVENESGEVNMRDGVSTESFTTETDANGEFTTPALTSGNYTVYPEGKESSHTYTNMPAGSHLVFAPVDRSAVERENSDE